MKDRYSLRFESGDREGETIPLTGARFTIGRRPGNSLQISDGSVSGKHAELRIEDDGGLSVHDLGSTNGTRVGSSKITEHRVAHGDRMTFGSVAVSIFDHELGEAGAAGGSTQVVEGGVATISADKIQRSGRKSRAGLLFGIAALLAVGGGTFMLLGQGKAAGKRVKPVVAVAGNLIDEGYSFEGEEDSPWISDEAAPGGFLRTADARNTGELGMQAELEAGEWARLVSPRVAAREGQTLELRAALRAQEGAGGRIGVEFLRGDGPDAPGPIYFANAWSAEDQGGGFDEIELFAPVPPACTAARVIVEARAGSVMGGTVDVDDISLSTTSGGITATAEEGGFRLFQLGDPPQALALYKVARPLFGDLHLRSEIEGALPRTTVLSIQEDEVAQRLRVTIEGGRENALLSLRVEPDGAAGGIATMGADGYREHGLDFDRPDATALLIGDQGDLIALRFDPPVKITGAAQGASSRVHVALLAARSFEGQIDFEPERARAGDLAHAARQAEKDSDLGGALRDWNEILQLYPFEDALVAEAEAARGRLVQAGVDQLAAARVVLERANFFRLIDLFRRCRESTEEVAASYEGTEVAGEAVALLAEIDAGLSTLEAELDQDEIRRLRSIQAFLTATDSPKLAMEVSTYLAQEFGVVE